MGLYKLLYHLVLTLRVGKSPTAGFLANLSSVVEIEQKDSWTANLRG